MNRHRSVAALLCAVAFVGACEKNGVQDITQPTPPAAQIRFFNFGVNAPSSNFYANTTKMTATGSAVCSPTPTDTMQQRLCRETGQEATTGVAYGGVGSAGLYAQIAPGTYDLKATIAATVDKDLAIVTVNKAIEADKYYSFYVSGFYNTTAKTAEGFVVEDALPAFDYGQVYVRFVNGISNSSPMTLYAKNTAAGGVESAVGADVAYKAAGAFTALPAGTYDLNTRVTGSATNVITRTAVAFTAGRVYTISARGDMTVVSTTATNRPFLDNTVNR